MARSWFNYIKTTPTDRLIASNYSAIPFNGNPSCNPIFADNICAVLATVSITQPVLTFNLQFYLNAAAVNLIAEPFGIGIKKYVYVKAQ